MEHEGEDPSAVTRAVADELSLLTVQEVAAFLKVKPTWLYDRVEAGDFPVIRVGRLLRFRPADIRDYLEARTQPARWHPRNSRVAHEGSRVRGRPRRLSS